MVRVQLAFTAMENSSIFFVLMLSTFINSAVHGELCHELNPQLNTVYVDFCQPVTVTSKTVRISGRGALHTSPLVDSNFCSCSLRVLQTENVFVDVWPPGYSNCNSSLNLYTYRDKIKDINKAFTCNEEDNTDIYLSTRLLSLTLEMDTSTSFSPDYCISVTAGISSAGLVRVSCYSVNNPVDGDLSSTTEADLGATDCAATAVDTFNSVTLVLLAVAILGWVAFVFLLVFNIIFMIWQRRKSLQKPADPKLTPNLQKRYYKHRGQRPPSSRSPGNRLSGPKIKEQGSMDDKSVDSAYSYDSMDLDFQINSETGGEKEEHSRKQNISEIQHTATNGFLRNGHTVIPMDSQAFESVEPESENANTSQESCTNPSGRLDKNREETHSSPDPQKVKADAKRDLEIKYKEPEVSLENRDERMVESLKIEEIKLEHCKVDAASNDCEVNVATSDNVQLNVNNAKNESNVQEMCSDLNESFQFEQNSDKEEPSRYIRHVRTNSSDSTTVL